MVFFLTNTFIYVQLNISYPYMLSQTQHKCVYYMYVTSSILLFFFNFFFYYYYSYFTSLQ